MCVLWAVSQSTIRILQVNKIYECLISLIPNGFMKWIKYNKLNPTPSTPKCISFYISISLYNRRHCSMTYAKMVYVVYLNLCLVLDDCVLCAWVEELINIDIVSADILWLHFFGIVHWTYIEHYDKFWLRWSYEYDLGKKQVHLSKYVCSFMHR